jgi:hypothetical protein
MTLLGGIFRSAISETRRCQPLYGPHCATAIGMRLSSPCGRPLPAPARDLTYCHAIEPWHKFCFSISRSIYIPLVY